MPRIHLIDASPYIFRAFFSLPASMRAPDGRPVNAVYGFAGTLLKLFADEETSHCGVAFDKSLTTSFRNEIFPEYKAQRELPPADLERQLDDCEAFVRALGLHAFSSERYEADDLIGSLIDPLLAESDDHRIVVVTSDKDLAQLVGPRVELFDLAKGDRLDAEAVRAKLGVPPERVADFLGLAGDSVDNIPGVRGVGAKTAQALLDALGSLESIYADLDAVESVAVRGAKSVRRKLEEQREQAEMSKRLATVVRDAGQVGLAGVNAASLRWRGGTRADLEAWADDLGFGERLLARVPRWSDDEADDETAVDG